MVRVIASWKDLCIDAVDPDTTGFWVGSGDGRSAVSWASAR